MQNCLLPSLLLMACKSKLITDCACHYLSTPGSKKFNKLFIQGTCPLTLMTSPQAKSKFWDQVWPSNCMKLKLEIAKWNNRNWDETHLKVHFLQTNECRSMETMSTHKVSLISQARYNHTWEAGKQQCQGTAEPGQTVSGWDDETIQFTGIQGCP